MTRRLLVLTGDQGPFFFSVESGTLTLGRSPDSADAVLRGLHVSRIRCEVEVEEDQLLVGKVGDPEGDPQDQELRPGETLQVGQAHLSLEMAPAGLTESPVGTGEAAPRDDLPGLMGEEPTPASIPAETPSGPQEPRRILRLVVTDGADEGQRFPLPEQGTVTLGNSQKHADFVLHDLYVARVHCQLTIEDGTVQVSHVAGTAGTLINGQRITEPQSLDFGMTLRVGNSHLTLESVSADAIEKEEEVRETVALAREEADEVSTIPVAEERAREEPAEDTPGEGPYALPHGPVDELLKLEDQVLGHYQISRLLGRGQAGAVFRAQDLRSRQVVALKVLSPDFPSSDGELQRFVQALKITTSLQQTYLVNLYGAGRSNGFCWIAREYVRGQSVSRLLRLIEKGEKPDWQRACRVAIHLGKALDFLYQHGVTHGNITPRNILISHVDQTTKLTDLMINQALHGSQLQKAILGRKLLVEMPYLAPEQTDPHAIVAPVADLYALGAVVYALLTGRPPFTGTSANEIRTRAREGKVARPSKSCTELPATFEAVVLKMLARRPEDRFPTAAAMLAAIEPIAQAHEVQV
jgi:pSer/pThr/pTyr-binding forkhead associated (FHA) protein